MSDSISVVIPVGPYEANTHWLREAIESVERQTVKPDTILLIDDMAGFTLEDYASLDIVTKRVRLPWHLGVGAAFNCGVALAPTDLVLMLGSDDTLEPRAIEGALDAYNRYGRKDAYYYFTVRYMASGDVQNVPCGAAMVTKGLWRETGGFPVEASTASDAALLSILMRHKTHPIIQIAHDIPLYNYRTHPETDTAKHGAWTDLIVQIRHLVTLEWTKPEWGRYE